ncbi:recombinase family protein [Oscillibacter sp.]|uniref:recombinase family protein n=1 Tax=Oscillibacter sp. TaxID=1945593 RepID=UPI00289D130E|nr:recombinase family protein [Oscillibacter sp.]
MQFAEAHGYKVYTDLGYSGLDFERPALLQMKLDAADGMIDAILLDKVSCLGKDMEKINMWIAAVAQHGIEVIPVDLGRSCTPQTESIVKLVKQMDLKIRKQEEKTEKTKTPRPKGRLFAVINS